MWSADRESETKDLAVYPGERNMEPGRHIEDVGNNCKIKVMCCCLAIVQEYSHCTSLSSSKIP